MNDQNVSNDTVGSTPTNAFRADNRKRILAAVGAIFALWTVAGFITLGLATETDPEMLGRFFGRTLFVCLFAVVLLLVGNQFAKRAWGWGQVVTAALCAVVVVSVIAG